MILRIISNIQVIIFIALYSILTINSEAIHHKLSTTHTTIVQYNNLNPLQYSVTLGNSIASYTTEFISFKSHQEYIENLEQSLYILHQDLSLQMHRLKEIENLAPIISLSQNKNEKKYFVKILYSITNNQQHSMYFESQDSIPLNSLVINKDCILGRVIEKNENTYKVLSHTDPKFRLPVYTKESSVPGIIYGGKTKTFKPLNQTSEKTFAIGETILTISGEENIKSDIVLGNVGKDGIIVDGCKNYYQYAIVI